MARRANHHRPNEDGVQDSFLDIVANIVGILILLVIVVGIRAAMQPTRVDSAITRSSQLVITEARLEKKRDAIERLKHEIVEVRESVESLASRAEQLDLARIDVATYVAAVEQQLERERQKLSDAEAERLEIRSALAETDQQWQKLMLQKVAIASDAGRPQTIVHTPTPVVRTHNEQTIHLRLESGKVAIVPFERLTDLLHGRTFDAHRRDLQRQGGIGRLGPIGDFELHYALISRASRPGLGGVRQMLTFVAGEIRPTISQPGEAVEVALESGSALDEKLQSYNQRTTVVMIWVYPDSTTDFRPLQQAIRKRGFAVDLRLLDEGAHISFSPDGRKTSAQ